MRAAQPNEEFIEGLRSSGYIKKDGSPNFDRLQSASSADLITLSEVASEWSKASSLKSDRTQFSQAASSTLSGGPHPCANLRCRLKHVEGMARFAAFYSDNVYITNHFAQRVIERQHGAPDKLVSEKIVGDILVYSKLYPLIKSEIVTPITLSTHSCFNCMMIALHDQGTADVLHGLHSSLTERFIKEVTLTLSKRDQRYALKIEGPEDLVEHGSRKIVYRTAPKWLLDNKGWFDQVNSGKEVKIRSNTKAKTGISSSETRIVVSDLLFGLTLSKFASSALLTDKSIEIDLLQEISNDTQLEKRNKTIEENLSTIVPFIEDVPIAELIKVRARRRGEFVLFRNALNRAVDEARKESDSLTERQAQQLYHDVIHESLIRIDHLIAQDADVLRRKRYSQLAVFGGALVWGFFNSFTPELLVGGLGGAKGAGELASSMFGGKDSVARRDNMYFLWKSNQLSEKQKRSARSRKQLKLL